MDAAVIPPATPVRKRPKWSIHKSTAPPISMYLRHREQATLLKCCPLQWVQMSWKIIFFLSNLKGFNWTNLLKLRLSMNINIFQLQYSFFLQTNSWYIRLPFLLLVGLEHVVCLKPVSSATCLLAVSAYCREQWGPKSTDFTKSGKSGLIYWCTSTIWNIDVRRPTKHFLFLAKTHFINNSLLVFV